MSTASPGEVRSRRSTTSRVRRWCVSRVRGEFGGPEERNLGTPFPSLQPRSRPICGAETRRRNRCRRRTRRPVLAALPTQGHPRRRARGLPGGAPWKPPRAGITTVSTASLLCPPEGTERQSAGVGGPRFALANPLRNSHHRTREPLRSTCRREDPAPDALMFS